MFSARFWYNLDQKLNSYLPKKGTAVIVCWNLSHNPLGRAYLLYDFLKRRYRAKMVGPIFNKFGKDVWRPLRKVPLNIESFEASNFPNFLEEARSCADKIEEADVVVICKPRLPSIFIGLLIAEKTKAKVILDIDDYELAFFENQAALSTAEAISQGLNLSNPYHETWTRVSHSFIEHFPNIIVSNNKLQEKFGGTIIPHIRNERIFNPILYNRKKIRSNHGYTEKDKVVLFLGTPREHKGFMEIPKALKKIGNPDYKFCLIGKIRNPELKEQFEEECGDFVQIINGSDFRDLPEKLCLADLICLLQEEDSLVSEYQLPAKLMDAMAMSIPVLASPVGPLRTLTNEQSIIGIRDRENLAQSIDQVFQALPKVKAESVKNRGVLFKNQYSYQSASKKLDILLGASDTFNTRNILESIQNSIPGYQLALENKKAEISTHFKKLPIPQISEPFVSIIILTHNGLEHLQRLLTSIKENTDYKNFETVIWDNASTDDSLGYLKNSKELEVQIFESSENLSFSHANNLAAKKAKGELFLFLNNDIEVTHGWLTRLVFSHMNSSNVGATGCRLIYPIKVGFENSLKIQHDGIGFEEIKGVARPVNLKKGEPYQLSESGTEKALGVTGACLLVSKKHFLEVGGFDEQYNYGYEDVDLCLKLQENNMENYVLKDCVLFHYEFGSQMKNDSQLVSERRNENQKILHAKWQKSLLSDIRH